MPSPPTWTPAIGSVRAWVVNAMDGLDEISTLGPTRVSELRDGEIHSHTIDPREYRTAVARATAEQARAAADIDNWKAQIKLAETELQRLIRSPGGAVTQSEIDRARAMVDVNAAQLAVAQAAKDSAAAALQTANIQVEYTDIRAPIAGRAR